MFFKKHAVATATPVEMSVANDYRSRSRWLELAAFLLELLAIALVISWAWHSQTYWVLGAICVLAFVGFEIARVHTVPLLVNAVKSRHFGIVILGFVLVFATLLVLFAATVFENVNKADDGVNERVLNSPAMKALELEIQQAREKINSLAAFSNPEKAHAEMQDLKANEQARLAKIEKTKGQINSLLNNIPKNKEGNSAGKTLSAATAGCTNDNWYNQTYCGEVRNLKTQLKSLENSSTGGEASYNARYDEYNGLQTHLTSLEKQRADLLTSQGEGVVNAYKPEDTLIASLFGINPQKASFIKWLVFSAVLDLLGLGLRFLASMARFRANQEIDPDALKREYNKKVDAVMTLYGVDGLKGLFNGSTPALTFASVEPEQTRHDLSKNSNLPVAQIDSLPITANVETQPVMQSNFVATAKTTDSQPTMQSPLAETMTAKTTDSQSVALQPTMQSNLAEPMTAKTTDDSQQSSKKLCHGLYVKSLESREVIALDECGEKLRPHCSQNKNGEYSLTITHPSFFFSSSVIPLDNERVGKRYEPENQHFLGVKYNKNIVLTTREHRNLLNHFYLNHDACKKLIFAIDDESEIVEIKDNPTMWDIGDCIELLKTGVRDYEAGMQFIEAVEIKFDRDGYFTFTLCFSTLEDGEFDHASLQGDLLRKFLIKHKRLNEFFIKQEKAERKLNDEEIDIELNLDDDELDLDLSPDDDNDVKLKPTEKKQSFIGFVPPSNTPANKPKASNDSQVLSLAENPTNVVIDDSRNNTTVVYTNVVGDVATCPTCGSTFTRRNKRHKYCCEECRVKAHGFESKGHMMRAVMRKKGG